MKNLKERLRNIRKEIDEIDEKLVYLISKRTEYAREIAHLKMELNYPINDEKREMEIKERIYKLCKKYNLDFEIVWNVMGILMEYSKIVQREEINSKNSKKL
ncbi:chorismate mutase [Methanofervidicoccus abyssi]|uniref:Chorismate mutase n=1 Tax=Methanofervidicoccus abyssi TaxID=2082189 RepID=A0A401HPQ9_9EURY|nr:chorismate mutase [Methanofervidicoccus abyssi]GBF36203.1 chorismate mutase [Methanofervidicoccus abyssi]